MKNKNLTKKYFLLSTVLFIISVCIFIFVIFIIEKEKEKVRLISNDLSIANKEDVVVLKRAIRNYESSADSVENLLVKKDNVFSFISEIEAIANQNGSVASVQSIELFNVLKDGQLIKDTGETVPERTHGRLVINMKVDGSWEDISSFLLKMENFPKHLEIDAVRLSSVFDQNTKKQSWSSNFNIIVSTN